MAIKAGQEYFEEEYDDLSYELDVMSGSTKDAEDDLADIKSMLTSSQGLADESRFSQVRTNTTIQSQ